MANPLDTALTGLRVAQAQIGVISANIANASTPGYTRKILPQSTQVLQNAAVGVYAEAVIRNVDLNLQRDLWTQVSSSAEYQVRETYLNRIQQFHGPPEKELSIAAEISHLHDSFAALADSPEDRFLQSSTISQAQDTARKINQFSRLITTLRNDAQTEMKMSVQRVNDLLDQIADLNAQISNGLGVGRSVAIVEDKRDQAIKSLSEIMDLSFFPRGDGVTVVQTNQGVELVSTHATHLTFDPSPLAATTAYPASAAGIYVGDPAEDPFAVDITDDSPGGKLGGLITLRDQTFPKQMAQLDELAHKMALRFDAQGLRLFTNESGNIPSDDPPDSTVPTPVSYVGFSLIIQVNEAILNDSTLLQKGTYGATMATGSNEVLRRVLDYTFGANEYQQAIGDIDLRVSGNAPPNNTLQEYLGLASTNNVVGTRNLSSFPSPASLISSANGALNPGTDTFRMTFEEPDLGYGPINVDVALGAIPNGGGNFVQDLIAYINTTVIPALPVPSQTALTNMGVTFTEGASGQFRIQSNANITFDATGVANGMGEDGLELLGFAEGTTEATDPYFDVRVGNNEMTRITIGPADDEADLMTKLLAVPGLGVDDLNTSTDGFLRLRPGGSYTNPDYGGDIRIIGGPFTTSGAGAGLGVIPNGLGIISALFGSFSTGPQQDLSPITSVAYGSQTDASLTPPIPTTSFRTDYLGSGADVSTNVFGSQTILDFSQKMINEHTQETILVQSRKGDEETLKETLERQLADQSGVNIDEELGNLITMQTAYAASARVISAVNRLFDDLLAAI